MIYVAESATGIKLLSYVVHHNKHRDQHVMRVPRAIYFRKICPRHFLLEFTVKKLLLFISLSYNCVHLHGYREAFRSLLTNYKYKADNNV